MKTVAKLLMIALGILASVATLAETVEAPGPDQAVCSRRDVSPEEYNQKCVIQDGPPHRPIHRKPVVRSKTVSR